MAVVYVRYIFLFNQDLEEIYFLSYYLYIF